MMDKVKRFIVKKLIKILEWFSADDISINEFAEEENEVVSEKASESEEINKKFFGNESLFDKVKEIELEIFPFKKYSLSYYDIYKLKLDRIVKEIEKYYEEQENKEEIYLRVLSGADYLIEIEKNLYNLLNEIKQYKKENFNYEMGMYILNSTKEYLSKVYFKLLGTSDIIVLENAYKTLNCKLEEIYKLDIEDCVAKQEEMCKRMCECIYIFLKCNTICDNSCDISKFKIIFFKEKNVFWNILLENVTDLLGKVEILKNTKYYNKYESYLRAIIDKCNVEYSVLLNENFLKSFVNNEKKVIELYFYYTTHVEQSDVSDDIEDSNIDNFDAKEVSDENQTNNISENISESEEHEEYTSEEKVVFTNEIDNDTNNISIEESQSIVKIEELKNYLSDLRKLYEYDMYNLCKIYFWHSLIYDFKYDITEYEVYKLVYFFGLKTFLSNHLKTVEKNDLMKRIFNSQKDVKISVPRKLETQNDKYIKVFEFDPKRFDLAVTRKILSKLSIHLEERNISEDLTEFYCSAEFFADCNQIMKNLNEI